MQIIGLNPELQKALDKKREQAQDKNQAPSTPAASFDPQALSTPIGQIGQKPKANGADILSAFDPTLQSPKDVEGNNSIMKTGEQRQDIQELEQNQKRLEASPQAQEQDPQEVFKSFYTLGQRNTGIAYFDNKKDLSLMDAYIAHKLGLKVARLEHKIDLKSDNKHRVDSVTKFADSSSKNAYYADTLMRGFGTNIANDQSSLTGAIDEKLRQILRGNFGFGEAAEQSANNSILLAIAQKSAGGSTMISKPRIDMISREYYQADSIDKKAQVIKMHLLGVRDALMDNAKRAQASGALEHAQKDIAKIKEIDAFVARINNNDYNGIAKFLSVKNNFTPMPMASGDYDSRSMAEQALQ